MTGWCEDDHLEPYKWCKALTAKDSDITERKSSSSRVNNVNIRGIPGFVQRNDCTWLQLCCIRLIDSLHTFISNTHRDMKASVSYRT